MIVTRMIIAACEKLDAEANLITYTHRSDQEYDIDQVLTTDVNQVCDVRITSPVPNRR